MLDITTLVLRDEMSDNATGADNQQERLSIDSIPVAIGNFLSGFALGEGSFMIVCRPRVDYRRGWKLSAAFNVSQSDVTPLELFREQLGCGTIRKAGNDGWYLEVNTLGDIQSSVIPFFRRFPMVGRKTVDFDLFEAAVGILSRRPFTDSDYREVLRLREILNRGGNGDTRWRESSETIRRTPQLEPEGMR